jgi:hypothetical protein
MDDVHLHHDLDLRDPRAVAKSIRLHCAMMPDCEVTLDMTADTALALADVLDQAVPERVAHVPRLHLDAPDSAEPWKWVGTEPAFPKGQAILCALCILALIGLTIWGVQLPGPTP